MNIFKSSIAVSGSYIYTEASAPRRPSDKAELESITLLKGTQHCLTFYYNMYGAEMGQLNILRKAC